MQNVMKIKSSLYTNVAAVLVLLSALAIHHAACIFFWGEPECPECFKS